MLKIAEDYFSRQVSLKVDIDISLFPVLFGAKFGTIFANCYFRKKKRVQTDKKAAHL